MIKDYYRILGVLDDAEDIVIKAAYKALAQRYHPDKWSGDKAQANRRMAEINEAYNVLSDSRRRSQYDAGRNKTNYQANDESEEGLSESIQEEWFKVLIYYPDLLEIESNLRKISVALAQSYKLLMLENRDFVNRKVIAEEREKRYLANYFGTNKKVLKFAKSLILSGNKDAARELNEAICLLGDKIDPAIVIKRIRRMHGLDNVFIKIKIATINLRRLLIICGCIIAAFYFFVLIASVVNDIGSSPAAKPSFSAPSSAHTPRQSGAETSVDSPIRSVSPQSYSPTIETLDRKYAASIRSCIQQGVLFPIPPRQGSSNPTAHFVLKLSSDSSVVAMTLKRSSGNAGFDRAVESGIRKCQPFPRSNADRENSDIEVTYGMYE